MPEQESRVVYNTQRETSIERMQGFRRMSKALTQHLEDLPAATTEQEYVARLHHISEMASSIRNIAVVECRRFDKPLAINGKLNMVPDNDNDGCRFPDEY